MLNDDNNGEQINKATTSYLINKSQPKLKVKKVKSPEIIVTNDDENRDQISASNSGYSELNDNCLEYD